MYLITFWFSRNFRSEKLFAESFGTRDTKNRTMVRTFVPKCLLGLKIKLLCFSFSVSPSSSYEIKPNLFFQSMATCPNQRAKKRRLFTDPTPNESSDRRIRTWSKYFLTTSYLDQNTFSIIVAIFMNSKNL